VPVYEEDKPGVTIAVGPVVRVEGPPREALDTEFGPRVRNGVRRSPSQRTDPEGGLRI